MPYKLFALFVYQTFAYALIKISHQIDARQDTLVNHFRSFVPKQMLSLIQANVHLISLIKCKVCKGKSVFLIEKEQSYRNLTYT